MIWSEGETGEESLVNNRRLFKLLHQVMVMHCNVHTDEAPEWKIAGQTFETSLAVQLQNLGPDRHVSAI